MLTIGIYILQCSNGRYYTGSTNNLARRLEEHQKGRTPSLRHILPIVLVLFQACDTIELARKVEYRVKRLKSRKLIERFISNQKIDNQYMQP